MGLFYYKFRRGTDFFVGFKEAAPMRVVPLGTALMGLMQSPEDCPTGDCPSFYLLSSIQDGNSVFPWESLAGTIVA
jgi:hypothetical protein